MEKNQKPSKEDSIVADKFIFPAEGKDYSDFKQMEMLLNKIAKGMEAKFPNVFGLWLKNGQTREDFADFVARAVGEGFNIPAEKRGEGCGAAEASEDDTTCDPADEGEDEEYTQEDADEEFQMLEDRDRE